MLIKYCISEWEENNLYINLVGASLWRGPLGAIRRQCLNIITGYFREFLVGKWIVVGSDSEWRSMAGFSSSGV